MCTLSTCPFSLTQVITSWVHVFSSKSLGSDPVLNLSNQSALWLHLSDDHRSPGVPVQFTGVQTAVERKASPRGWQQWQMIEQYMAASTWQQRTSCLTRMLQTALNCRAQAEGGGRVSVFEPEDVVAATTLWLRRCLLWVCLALWWTVRHFLHQDTQCWWKENMFHRFTDILLSLGLSQHTDTSKNTKALSLSVSLSNQLLSH